VYDDEDDEVTPADSSTVAIRAVHYQIAAFSPALKEEKMTTTITALFSPSRLRARAMDIEL
jgi:hypothetical protein